MKRIPARALTLACIALILWTNVYIVREIFFIEYCQRMDSIESSYMSIARWMKDHWGEHRWFPVWFCGMPFRNVYQPGLHVTVAGVATALGISVQRAYHAVTGLEYCLGPVTLFLLIWWATRRRTPALLAALAYSLISPLNFLVPGIRYDTGTIWGARRLDVMVRYGEGPHTTALMLLPLVVWAVHGAATRRRWWYAVVAPVLLAALVLTNWPGTMGLVMALAAWFVSRLGDRERPVHFPSLIGVAVLAYLIAFPWIPPSTIRTVQRNAQQSDMTMLGGSQFISFALLALAVLGLHLLFQRMQAERWLRFFAYFTLLTGAVSVGREWFGWRLLPQPNRFQLEFEMAFLGLLALAGILLWRRQRRPEQAAIIAVLLLLCVSQVIQYRRFARRLIRPIEIEKTIEHRMGTWFPRNMPGQRVFASGNVSLWMNMWSDHPQVDGCCDQGMPGQIHRIANYVIYTGDGTKDRDAEIATLWLKAYGADAVGVTGPNSGEPFRPWWNPKKFDGVLRELWRDGDSAIYEVPRVQRSLAHVIRREDRLLRQPANGIDVEPLTRYVAALDAPDAPLAEFRWLDDYKARITADVRAGDIVVAQITHDAGWRVSANGREQRTAADPLTLTVIEPDCTGRCTFELEWVGSNEDRVAPYVAGAGWLGIAAAAVLARRRRPI